ncbi:MAG: PAS domain S-box protein [Desulfobacterales bacterium]
MQTSQPPQNLPTGFHRLRKDQLRYILDNISDYVCLHDLEGKILAVNRTMQNHAGIADPRQVVGQPITLFMPEKYQTLFDDYMARLLKKGANSGLVSLIIQTGEERVIEYNSLLIYDDADQPQAVASLGRDITERLRSEKALKKSEEKYRNILETIEDGYYEVDLSGSIKFCNPALCRILGYSESELLEKNYREICEPSYINTIYNTFNKVYHSRESTKAFDWRLIRKDGSACFVETSVSLIEADDQRITGFRGICRDVTDRIEAEKERQSLENQLFYSQKMEALGTLAGGFAHNFNNILFPLIGYIDMALMQAPADSRTRQHMEKALESANKAKNIVHRVQEYTRNDKGHQIQPLDVPEVVDQALRLVRGSLSSRIKLSTEMDDGCPQIMADAGQIQHVIVNLCANANDAIMSNGRSGHITVKVSCTEITPAGSAKAGALPQGRYACISVTDSGCGIDSGMVDRVFDPFYTTKPETGKGLGLSLSHRIVKKYGGEILIESQVGEGTAVNVYIPEMTADAQPDENQ